MSFTQFHHCKPLAGIWGAHQPQHDSSKHNFSSYNLPPLIIPSSNQASSSPPSSPASSQSFSSASSSSSASPVTLPSASLYTKRDIWGSFSVAESEPVFNCNPLPTKSNEFHLTPLNEMYDRIPFDPLSTSSSTSEFSVFSPTNVIQNQYSPNHEYFESLTPMNAYTDSLIESPIDSIPSTPISDSSFDSMVSSPITPVDSPIHSHHTNHIHNHIKHSDSINTSTTTTSTTTNNRKKSRKSDIKINKKKLSVNTELYKTELCATFVKSGGYCPYGDKCQFAHGSTELKLVDRPSNWRSKPCQNWLKTGACAYNERCCFRHD